MIEQVVNNVNCRNSGNCVQFGGSMVDVGVNECDNTVNGKNQFVCLVLVHLLLIGLNGTNGNCYFFECRDTIFNLIF